MVKNFKPLNDAVEKLTTNLAIRRHQVASNPKETVAEQPSPQMLLELWPDTVRGVPNVALRGALFSISQQRTITKKLELLAAVEGLEIGFQGERFNQTDLDIWEMLLHLARSQPLGDRVEFSAHALLKALGRGTSGKHHEELKDEIRRLRGGTVEIKWKKEGKMYGGSLVSEYFYDEASQRYVVIFNEKMLSLYEGGYSHIDWEQRKKLGNNSLAKWLHGFYASHADAYPYKVETIRTLCGSTTERLGDFRKQLRLALGLLKKVDAITDSDINSNDHLIIMRIPTLSQQRSLQKPKR